MAFRVSIVAVLAVGCGGLSATTLEALDGDEATELDDTDVDGDDPFGDDADDASTPKGDDDDDDDDDAGPSDTGTGPGTTDTDTDTEPLRTCSPVPTVGLNAQSPSPSVTFTPSAFSIEIVTSIDGASAIDYRAKDQAGAWNDLSAIAYVDFFVLDVNGDHDPLCFAAFDLSTSAVPHTGTWAAGAYRAWRLNLNAQAGYTDCPSLASSFSSEPDPRAFVANADIGVAFGPLAPQLRSELRAIIDADPSTDWATEWDPYIFGYFVTLDATVADPPDPMGYTFGFERDCAEVYYENPLARATSSAMPHHYIGNSFYVYVF